MSSWTSHSALRLPSQRLRRRIIEAVDKACPEGKFHHILKDKRAVDQINVVRKINGRVAREYVSKAAAATDAETYFTADLTKNPATVSFPTSGATVDTSKGTFQDNAWRFASGTGVSFTFPETHQIGYLTNVQLNITGTATLVDPNLNGTISFIVNDIDIYTAAPINQLSNEDGTFSFFIPAISLKTTSNIVTLQVNQNLSLDITNMSVITAQDTGIDVSFEVLSQILATVGAENSQISEDFGTITKIIGENSDVFTADILAKAVAFQAEFAALMSKSNTSLINLRAMCNQYYSVTFPLLMDPTLPVDLKKEALGNLKTQVSEQMATSATIRDSMKDFANRMHDFQTQLQGIIFAKETEIQKKLTDLSGKIKDLQNAISAARTALAYSGGGLGLSLFVGLIGLCLVATGVGAPLGIGLIGVGIAGAVTSAVFMGLSIKAINDMTDTLNGYLDQQAALQSQQAELEKLKTTMNTVYSSIGVIENFVGVFYNLWNYLYVQLSSILAQTDMQLAQGNLFAFMLPQYQTNVGPYFNHIVGVLDAYLNNSNIN